jgi:hypothetical protein
VCFASQIGQYATPAKALLSVFDRHIKVVAAGARKKKNARSMEPPEGWRRFLVVILYNTMQPDYYCLRNYSLRAKDDQIP